MKSKIILCLALAVAVFGETRAQAVVLFDEDFDGSPYMNNTPFNDPSDPVTGLNKLDHGYWSLSNAGTGVVSASTAASLSPSRSMALTVSANGDRAQSIGFLGVTGSAGTTTTDALVIKFAFNLQDASRLSSFLVRDTNDRNLGALTFVSGNVLVNFGGTNSTISAILSNTWYNIEMTMSANPGSGADTYSVRLFNADFSSQLGTTMTGAFGQTSLGGSYRYITAYNNGYSGQSSSYTSYFDNITVNAIPEPGVVACVLLGGAGLAVLRVRRRNTGNAAAC